MATHHFDLYTLTFAYCMVYFIIYTTVPDSPPLSLLLTLSAPVFAERLLGSVNDMNQPGGRLLSTDTDR